MSARYVVRPKADADEQALYLAEEASPEVGHRFLTSAHETFSLLASQPHMGWQPRLKNEVGLEGLRLFRVSGFTRMIVLYRPMSDGVEILRVIHGSQDIMSLLRKEGLA